jgi:hypothetical protein
VNGGAARGGVDRALGGLVGSRLLGSLATMNHPQSPPAEPRCLDHGTAAIARCATCSRALCDLCFRFRLDTRPACARCAYEVTTRKKRRGALAAAFLVVALGGGGLVVRLDDLWRTAPVEVVLGALAVAVVAYFIGKSGQDAGEPALENREPGALEISEGDLQGSASPYRARARHAVMAVAPKLSGKATALVVGASLVGAAVLLPASVKLPRWIEAEIVLGVWWVILGATLATLLHRGFRIKDDYVYFLPWDRPQGADPKKPLLGTKGSGCTDGIGCADGCSGIDGEGAILGLFLLVAIPLALGLAWVLVELAMPIAFLAMYTLLMAAIRRASRDRRGCQGDLAKSIGWGALWATIYLLPLAGITWALHFIKR